MKHKRREFLTWTGPVVSAVILPAHAVTSVPAECPVEPVTSCDDLDLLQLVSGLQDTIKEQEQIIEDLRFKLNLVRESLTPYQERYEQLGAVCKAEFDAIPLRPRP